jgi:hypothetical protein
VTRGLGTLAFMAVFYWYKRAAYGRIPMGNDHLYYPRSAHFCILILIPNLLKYNFFLATE